MGARQVFLDSIELSSVPPAVLVDSPRDSPPPESPALSRKPSFEYLAESAAWAPTLKRDSPMPPTELAEDQNTKLRRFPLSRSRVCHLAGRSSGATLTAMLRFSFTSKRMNHGLPIRLPLCLQSVQLFVINGFRRYPEKVKPALMVSAIVYSGSMLASSWANNVWQLMLLQGVLCGCSGAVLYSPVLLWLNGWFFSKRGLASGIVFSGTGMGGACFPFMIGGILDHLGFAWMCRLWSLLTGAVFAISIIFLKPRIPLRRPVGSESDRNGSNVTGYASDISLPWTVSSIGVAGGIVALSAWGTATTLGKVFGFAVLYGFNSQICSCWGPAARDVAGANPQSSTTIFCLFGVVRGVASLIGPYTSTALYNEKEASEGQEWGRFGFRKIIVFVGLMSFTSAIGGVVLGYLRKKLAAQKQSGASGA
ncbi:uncharacterized protein JCM6883_005397 [Sporobolomyces salmoneus]|uniref:uncharacterized protein n=1 Tax=Sporobolomyces salmoneus TaxID=183962 RepID=UPI00317B018E